MGKRTKGLVPPKRGEGGGRRLIRTVPAGAAAIHWRPRRDRGGGRGASSGAAGGGAAVESTRVRDLLLAPD